MPTLEGIERISLRDVIFREVASNILIHREYSSGASSRLIIEYGKVTTENPNRPHGFGMLDLATVAPFPKNPVIGAFFREIQRADELGSGMHKMMLYGKKYGCRDPQLMEGDLFRMVISVPEFGEKLTVTIPAHQVEAHDDAHDEAHDLTEIEKSIMTACAKEAYSTPELLIALGYRTRTGNFKKALAHLIDIEGIERTIPDAARSKNQKYPLTDKGRALLDTSMKKGPNA